MRILLGVSIVLMALVAQINAQNTATAAQPTAALPAETSNTGSTPAATTAPVNTGTNAGTNTGTTESALPALTSSNANLPAITTQLPGITQQPSNVPSYAVTIPNNANNPFLKTSPMPDGTVFIIVGSCLAGLALIVIAWRALYIWFLHRETKKAQRNTDLKYAQLGDQRPLTTYTGSGMGINPFASNISLDYLRPGDRTSRHSTLRPSSARPPTSGGRPPSSGSPLTNQGMQFYSPSAHPGGTTAAALGTQPGQRDSAYLPAGYYLRDASSPTIPSTSPGQAYSRPSSMFLADSSAPPMPRLSRTSSGNTMNTVFSNGRPQTAGATMSVYGGATARPPSSRDATPQQQYTQPRRTVSSGREETTYAGDRRSKPSQFLDDLLGGGGRM